MGTQGGHCKLKSDVLKFRFIPNFQILSCVLEDNIRLSDYSFKFTTNVSDFLNCLLLELVRSNKLALNADKTNLIIFYS